MTDATDHDDALYSFGPDPLPVPDAPLSPPTRAVYQENYDAALLNWHRARLIEAHNQRIIDAWKMRAIREDARDKPDVEIVVQKYAAEYASEFRDELKRQLSEKFSEQSKPAKSIHELSMEEYALHRNSSRSS
jgi:hypothetical protein